MRSLNDTEKSLRQTLEQIRLQIKQETQELAYKLGVAESEVKNKIAQLVTEAQQAHDILIARIIEKTKFEQVEQLQLEGFPANNYIYCIEPATGEKDSFDVGTYGMII